MKSNPVFEVVELLLVMLVLSFIGLIGLVSKPLADKLAAPFEFYADRLMERFCFFAVVNTKSGMVTDFDATPVDLVAAYRHHGRLREMNESFSIANGDSATSVLRVLRVWSGWRVSSLVLNAPDIGTTTAADVGLYKVAADGGAVVDADFFASAQALNAGPYANLDITRENAVITPANADQRIWEQLGLSADPQLWYDVALTLTGAADAAGVGDLTLRYVDGT